MNKVRNQLFPGYLDRGSPVIAMENERYTIMGMFREYLQQDHRGPAIFDRLYPEVVNWIVENSDWTHDSTCSAFTSCTCGVPDGKPAEAVPRHKRSFKRSANSSSNNHPLRSNRILHGTDVTDSSQYPWEAIVFNRLKHYGDRCSATHESEFFRNKDPDGVEYDLCSGSLITNKHILTSANCILKNRAEMEQSQHSGKKLTAEYTRAWCLFAILGNTDRVEAVNNGQILAVKDRFIHPQAFTDVKGEFNYNLGM